MLGAAVVMVALWIYGADRYDPAVGLYFDGLGRELHEGFSISGSDLTPGILWELVDTVIAIALVGVCAGLHSLGRRLDNR